MAKTKMVNFRVSEADADKLNEMAAIAGMNRSDYIKSCLQQALQQGVRPPAPQPPKPSCVEGQPVGCQQAQWAREPTGVKVCLTCGVRKR